MGERPVATVRVAGLDQRDLRVVGFVLRHCAYNRFDFRLDTSDSEAHGTVDADLVLADSRDPHGARLLALADSGASPVGRVEVVPGGEDVPATCASGVETIELDRLATQLLPALNRAFERRLAARAAHAPGVGKALPGEYAGAHEESESGEEAEAAEAAEAGEGASGDDAGVASDAGVARVLVVDDSPTVRRQLGVALDRLGLGHEAVGSATQALERLGQEDFDLVLVDVMMPGIDGYRLTREIRRDRRTRHLPVIILTSRSSPFDLARGALAGCDAYLTKPVPFRALESAVGKQLRRVNRDASRASGSAAPAGDEAGIDAPPGSRLSRLLGR